jgi:hypothetical protein
MVKRYTKNQSRQQLKFRWSSSYWLLALAAKSFTLQKNVIHSLVFLYSSCLETDEYIQIIFVRLKIDEYKVIFVGLGLTPTNI